MKRDRVGNWQKKYCDEDKIQVYFKQENHPYKRELKRGIANMKYVTVSEFVENIEEIIDNALLNEEMANVETEDGEHLILMTEHQYDCFIEAMAKKRAIN